MVETPPYKQLPTTPATTLPSKILSRTPPVVQLRRMSWYGLEVKEVEGEEAEKEIEKLKAEEK